MSDDFLLGECSPGATVQSVCGSTGTEAVYLWTGPTNIPKNLTDNSDKPDVLSHAGPTDGH